MSASRRALVWDFPTRLFHVLLITLFVALLFTGWSEDMDWAEWHMRFGYGMLGLLVFRLLWGMVAGDYAHFSRFPLGWRSMRGYLKGEHPVVGHNPLGSWMVVALLGGLLLQVLSGLATTDDIFVEGPWVSLAGDWSSALGRFHRQWYLVLIALVSLHVLAVVFYRWVRKQDLISPMLHGLGELPPHAIPARPTAWYRWLAIAFAAAAVAWGMVVGV